MLEKENKIG